MISATLLGMFTVIDATLRLPLTEDGTRVCNRYLFGKRFNKTLFVDHDVK
jgi:hypothetical protein